MLPMQGTQVRSLVRELEILHTATKSWCSQIDKYFLKVLIASYFAIFATLKQLCEEDTTNLLEPESLRQQSANS